MFFFSKIEILLSTNTKIRWIYIYCFQNIKININKPIQVRIRANIVGRFIRLSSCQSTPLGEKRTNSPEVILNISAVSCLHGKRAGSLFVNKGGHIGLIVRSKCSKGSARFPPQQLWRECGK